MIWRNADYSVITGKQIYGRELSPLIRCVSKHIWITNPKIGERTTWVRKKRQERNHGSRRIISRCSLVWKHAVRWRGTRLWFTHEDSDHRDQLTWKLNKMKWSSGASVQYWNPRVDGNLKREKRETGAGEREKLVPSAFLFMDLSLMVHQDELLQNESRHSTHDTSPTVIKHVEKGSALSLSISQLYSSFWRRDETKDDPKRNQWLSSCCVWWGEMQQTEKRTSHYYWWYHLICSCLAKTERQTFSFYLLQHHDSNASSDGTEASHTQKREEKGTETWERQKRRWVLISSFHDSPEQKMSRTMIGQT